MRRSVGGACVLALTLHAAGPAAADELACGDAIVTLAAFVLDGRDALPPLRARRIGAEAGYLTLRYGGLSNAQQETFLQGLREEQIVGAFDLSAAWYVHNRGLVAAREALGDDLLRDVDTIAGVSLTRALLLAGETEAVIAELSGANQSAAAAVYIAVLDQPDALKAALAAAAAEAGLTAVAAGLVATQTDPTAWTTFARGLDASTAEGLTSVFGVVPAFVGNPVLPRPDDKSATAETIAIRAATEAAFIVAARQPERQYLTIFLNQTDDWDAGRAVSGALEAALDGGMPEAGPLDEGWLVVYRALQGAADPSGIASLRGVSLGADRYGRSDIGSTIDWLAAVEALAPYAAGGGKGPQAVPDEVSADFAAGWPQWTAVADTLRAEPLSPALLAEEAFPIAAELTLAVHAPTGDLGPLVALFEAAGPTPASVEMANDFVMRLDRICGEAYLRHPAESLVLSGEPIFKFD